METRIMKTTPEQYQHIQDTFELWLIELWKGIPIHIKRPNFKEAARQYSNCRRVLDQEFLKEYGVNQS